MFPGVFPGMKDCPEPNCFFCVSKERDPQKQVVRFTQFFKYLQDNYDSNDMPGQLNALYNMITMNTLPMLRFIDLGLLDALFTVVTSLEDFHSFYAAGMLSFIAQKAECAAKIATHKNLYTLFDVSMKGVIMERREAVICFGEVIRHFGDQSCLKVLRLDDMTPMKAAMKLLNTCDKKSLSTELQSNDDNENGRYTGFQVDVLGRANRDMGY